ncbi:MAG: phosphoribosylformylglycinamidine synthase subunit PurL [Planctomycetes bacterium]|nr:phosphoribosylformylglycinamidine synthase subunit PurL [Planctomycetota bacterium]
MRWQIEVLPRDPSHDSLGTVLTRKMRALGAQQLKRVETARLYLLSGALTRADAERLAAELLADPVSEQASVHEWEHYSGEAPGSVAVFKKQGVMDSVEAGVLRGAASLAVQADSARTGMRYKLTGVPLNHLQNVAETGLANLAIETIQVGNDRFPAARTPAKARHARIEVPLIHSDNAALEALSKRGGLSLSLAEMQVIQAHFAEQDREPSEIELESVAQTWSEHCKHKTLCGDIKYSGAGIGSLPENAQIRNLLSSTIKDATTTLDREFCLSVFHDNAGVIAFEGDWALCMKVETHNHPSAIEPYGGAGTGLGGVIRDILGTGQGAKPVANVDVFCVGDLNMDAADVPKGAMHPRRILRGVVEGVRDYGNQMGIPTVSGGVFFDNRYVGNPLVFAGTVGLLPVNRVRKQVSPGDVILVLGGRTGRDGIHGATFSSRELHDASETADAAAVQIGNAITEKKLVDIVLQARDRDLFTSITDCGAGGFSSAVGEMGENCGARVYLERAPLKYEGLSPTEIWISESQERMVLAVPQDRVQALLDLAKSEDVEAFVLGEFTSTERLELYYGHECLGDISMDFLHNALPRVERSAVWTPPAVETLPLPAADDNTDLLLRLLGSPNIASKEWIIRQYDHEVQAGSVLKPLVGTRQQAPSDAAVVAPLLGSTAGFAIGLGMNPCYGDIDPYGMACAAIDEALRNVVAVGADPDHCAILDNFSWGNCAKSDRLGGLVRAAWACRDAAIALGTPFISGKDSLNNEYRVGNKTIVIPPTLLISALARVPDVRKTVSMDFKAADSAIWLVGMTRDELGGSHFLRLHGMRGNTLPSFDGDVARATFATLHMAIQSGVVRACHDLSEGGLAVALAEMVFAGEIGAEVDLDLVPVTVKCEDDRVLLYSESLTRFLVEVPEAHCARFTKLMAGVPHARIGSTRSEPRLTLRRSSSGRTLVAVEAAVMERAFRAPLPRALEGQERAHA